ncbi:MAG: hypothetical protein P4L81_04695, partial [Candidatus Pacebacteria bacterium]|nr:hypothetical protein [Candidatus Paceibacterota bacterium]
VFLFLAGFLAVIGNHDVFLLRCALLAGRLDSRKYASNSEIRNWSEEEVARSEITSEEYARTYYARMNGFEGVARTSAQHYAIAESLTDAQLTWLASLPLSIDLRPAGLPFFVVHAGLVPDLPLDAQHPYHLTTMRNFVTARDGELVATDSMKIGTAWSMRATEVPESARIQVEATAASSSPPASSAASTSSPTVLFGHDASRGFQRPNEFRLGLDTGCCNGKYLTGILLPDQRVVHVKARQVYSVPTGKVDVARPPPSPSGMTLNKISPTEPARPRAE